MQAAVAPRSESICLALDKASVQGQVGMFIIMIYRYVYYIVFVVIKFKAALHVSMRRDLILIFML